MKVLAVSTWYPTPAVPVSGVFVRKDAMALAQDHEVSMLHLAPPAAFASAPPEEDDGPVHVRRIALDLRRPDHHWRAAKAVQAAARDADLVHSSAFSTLLPMSLLRPSVPWVHTEHWSAIPTPESFLGPLGRLTVPQLTRFERLPDVVVPVCDFLGAPIRRRRSGPMHVVPCIVPLAEPVTPRPDPTEVLRLVAVGSLTDRKDPLTAVGTIAELKARGVQAQLTWVGDGPLRSAVQDRAAQLGVSDRVHLTGSLSPDEVASTLAASDLFLLPTLAENFCVSAAEAIAQGRPVVVGSNGGQAEYIDDTVGEVVSVQTPGAYADAVVRVWDRLRDSSADQIAARVGERFSVTAVRRGYAEAYRQAIAERARRHP